MDIDVASFNSLLKRIVELSLSITSIQESVQVFSLEEHQQCEAAASAVAESKAEQTSTSTIGINISDIEVEHDLGLSLRDDSSSEESDEDTDSEEDDPEMHLFVSQLLNQAEQLASSSSSSGDMTELFECLLKVKEFFAQEGRDNQELFACQLVHPDQEGSLEELYALSFNLFEATKGLSCQDDLIQIYLLVSSNIEGWLDVSEELCKQIAYHGLLLQDINHLVYFVNVPANSSQILQSAIETKLSIIYNCARNHVLPEFYYARLAWAKLIVQLLTAHDGNTGIRITCKLLANTLAECFQKEEHQMVLDLTVNDLSVLKATLIDASKSPLMVGRACDYQYSALELLIALRGFWHRPNNRPVLIDQSLLTAVCRLVEQGGIKEKVAAVKLLWCLLENENLKECLKQQHKNFLDLIKLEMSKTPESDELSVWYQGVLAVVQDHTIGGETDQLLATVRCCYGAEHYTRCMELCDTVSGVAKLQIYQGRALYQIYWKKRHLLRELKHDKQQFYKQHHACYEVAREAMKILGRAKDNGSIEVDAVSLKMLDSVMMDYILETNRLKEMKRCFLCLRRQQYEKGTEDKGQQRMASGDGGIKQSHLVPHGIIKRLAKVDGRELTNTKSVVFGVSGTKLDSQRTPATSTVYMLCGACEQMINDIGESPFISFFEKLIDPTLVDCQLQLKYGKELYYFCVSLIFRTLCPSQDEYINTDEVYQLLVTCRAYLLEGRSGKVEDLPKVLLFIHPFAQNETDEYKSFIEQSSVSYTSKFALDCRREELESFESVYANFFLVKMGVMIVVVIFRPLSRYEIHDNCSVSPDGGVYIVPSAPDRVNIIPAGVTTALQILFEVYTRDLDKFNKGKTGKVVPAANTSISP